MAYKEIYVRVVDSVSGTGTSTQFTGITVNPSDTVQLVGKSISQTMTPIATQNVADIDIATSYIGSVSYTINYNPTVYYIAIPNTSQTITHLNAQVCTGNITTITSYGVVMAIDPVTGVVEADVDQSYTMSECMAYDNITVQTY